ncbi:MAG: hypothetical protein IKV29_01965 [Alistipes sp.]|nr:hypothetical protein [Alistipes sp.]
MKTLRILFLVAVAIFSSLNIATIAEEPANKISHDTTLHKSSSDKQPKTLTPDIIKCYYEFGTLYFDTDTEMTNINVVITDLHNNISYSYYLDSSDYYVYLELTPGVYHLTFSSNLSYYEGVLSII